MTVARPEPGTTREYRFPRFDRHTLPNGMQLVIAPVTKLPLVTVVVVIEAGARTDPDHQEGLAHLVARALVEGTASSNGAELTERFERLGASVDSSVTWDVALASMTVMSTRFEKALAVLGEVLMEPAFPEREIERLKGERLAELLQLRAEPRGLGDEMFNKFLYASASRFAKPEGGTSTTVLALGRDDVDRLYDLRYQPGGVTLVIVGDVTTESAIESAGETFGSWGGGMPSRSAVIDLAARPTRAIHIVGKEDAPQSELRIGHVGLPRRHPDYFPVSVMNAVLGGLFSSRINLNLREAHGYTYGAFSAYEWRRDAGPFVVSSAVRSDVTEAATREILLEIDRIRKDEIAPDELSLATSYLDGVFPIKYETTNAIAAALATAVIYDLPDDYFDTYRAYIRGVTTQDVLRAAQAHLDPNRLQIVVVGDPRTIKGPLEQTGLGPVSVYDADGGLLL